MMRVRILLSIVAKPAKNVAILFADKEEIGSDGNTGANLNILYQLNHLHELF